MRLLTAIVTLVLITPLALAADRPNIVVMMVENHPQEFAELKGKWDAWADSGGVLTPEQFEKARADVRERETQTLTGSRIIRYDRKYRTFPGGLSPKWGAVGRKNPCRFRIRAE